MQGVNQFLCTSHRKGGHDHFAPAAVGVHDHIPELPLGRLDRIVEAIAVRTLRDEQVDVLRNVRIAQDRHPAPAQVAGESQPFGKPILLDIEHGDRRAQNVARVTEGQGHARGYRKGAAVAQAYELFQAIGCILHGVERLQRWQTPPGPLLVHIDGIVLLDVARIAQHGRAQVATGRGGEDIAAKPILDQRRNVARMVDVGVGKHEGVDGTRFEG